MNRTKDMAPDTLFYPFECGVFDWPERGQDILFLNAAWNPALERISEESVLMLQQGFKPQSDILQAHGFAVNPAVCEDEVECADWAFVLLPKNQHEAEYLLACALRALKEGGVLLAAADNKAGGARLEKTLAAFGLSGIDSLSKHKARVCRARKHGIHGAKVAEALSGGAARAVLGGQFVSRPGLFGWDKIDKGSQILLRHMGEDLKGKGADFGCGYGYLSRAIVQHKNVSSLVCADADFRALEACEQNVSAQNAGAKISFLWADLCAGASGLKGLDFIVMNPPFHGGKYSDSEIGAAFIRSASQALRPGGKLWMVANAHMPYEQVLQQNYAHFSCVYEGEGFKVFCAVR